MLSAGDLAPAFQLRPLFGLPVVVPPPAGGRPIVLCFVRDFASPFGRASMAAIQSRYPDFDRQGIPLVVLTRTELVRARDFVPRMHTLAPVIVDTDGGIFAAYQVGTDRWLLGTLAGLLRPDGPPRLLSALGHGQGGPHPRLRELGASFVVRPDGRLALARYDRSILDLPDLDALLACAMGA